MWVRVETNRCWYSVTSLGSPDTGRKKVEAKWLAGTLKWKWHLLPVNGKRKIRKLVVGQGSWRTELKPRTPGKRRARKRRNILHRNPSKYTQYIYTLSLSLSSWRKTENERKEKKKDICVHALFIYDIFDMLKVYIYV